MAKTVTGSVTATLGAGSAAIGKLAANDGVDVGDVTVNNAAGAGAYVQPGTDATFNVQSNSIMISQTPAVTAGAYSANDAVGGLLTFANAARATGKGGVVKNVLILDDAGQDAVLALRLPL